MPQVNNENYDFRLDYQLDIIRAISIILQLLYRTMLGLGECTYTRRFSPCGIKFQMKSNSLNFNHPINLIAEFNRVTSTLYLNRAIVNLGNSSIRVSLCVPERIFFKNTKLHFFVIKSNKTFQLNVLPELFWRGFFAESNSKCI